MLLDFDAWKSKKSICGNAVTLGNPQKAPAEIFVRLEIQKKAPAERF